MKPSKPLFKLGERVFIDVMERAGKIATVQGFDSFVGANVYEVTLDGSGKEVEWTEKHLSAVEDTRP